MGHRIDRDVYEVEISSDTRALLGSLSTYPNQVFERPYLGTFLFLFTEIDHWARRWLLDHARALDSLTGKDVGFGVFSASTPISPKQIIKTGFTTKDITPHDRLRPWQVRNLVKNGRIELADNPTDHELAVINETIYTVASEIGVTEHLPCIVGFDGVPHPDLPFVCIPIRAADGSNLYQVIQSAVGRLRQDDSISVYREGILQLSNSTDKLKSIKRNRPVVDAEKREAEAAKDRFFAETKKRMRATYPGLLAKCRSALCRGRAAYLRILIGKISEDFPMLPINAERLMEIPWDRLHRYRKTMFTLRCLSRNSWPLQDSEVDQFNLVYCEHVYPLLPNLPKVCQCRDQKDLFSLVEKLQKRLDEEIELLISQFPPASQSMLEEQEKLVSDLDALQIQFSEGVQESARRDDAAARRYSKKLTAAEFEAVKAARQVLDSPDRPSFCASLQGECRIAGVNIIPSSLSNQQKSSFWTSWIPIKSMVDWLSDRSFLKLPHESKELEAASWVRPQTAFASYASEDRDEVLRRIQGMRAWQPGLDIFVDFHSLFPGEEWKNRLITEISKRDRFFLFWSKAASRSDYVRLEWQTALSERGLSVITPVPIEPPDQVPPPAELAKLHFNDLYAELLRRSSTA